jgi:hypothetical protein
MTRVAHIILYHMSRDLGNLKLWISFDIQNYDVSNLVKNPDIIAIFLPTKLCSRGQYKHY